MRIAHNCNKLFGTENERGNHPRYRRGGPEGELRPTTREVGIGRRAHHGFGIPRATYIALKISYFPTGQKLRGTAYYATIKRQTQLTPIIWTNEQRIVATPDPQSTDGICHYLDRRPDIREKPPPRYHASHLYSLELLHNEYAK